MFGCVLVVVGAKFELPQHYIVRCPMWPGRKSARYTPADGSGFLLLLPQVKIDGVRMELEEIEAVLSSIPGAVQCCFLPCQAGAQRGSVAWISRGARICVCACLHVPRKGMQCLNSINLLSTAAPSTVPRQAWRRRR